MSAVPDAALDKHVALLGMTGAGKTSVIKTAIVEPDLEADRRVLIITPKDDWWGLRLSKTGKSTGFDIPIFGGRHADYSLHVKDAALLAETYGTMRGSAILCTSSLSVQDRARWFAAFAERLLATNRGWVRVVIDEAHVFMPKQGGKGGGAIPAALHAGNELVSQGRSGGLRIVLASQRSAKLHNDSLTQCSCLMAMLLMAPHDRDAVKQWIEDQADPERGKEIIASLASLKPGQAWVWAPGAKFLECVQFSRPATFDSSAAPDDDTASDLRLKPINLDALKGKLASVEAEAKQNDPKILKAEVARLQRELSAKPVVPAADPQVEQQAYARGKIDGYADAIKGVTAEFKVTIAALDEVERKFSAVRGAAAQVEEWAKRPVPTAPIQRFVPAARLVRSAPAPRSVSNGHAASDVALPVGERAVLIAAAQYEGVERDQLSVLTGYKRSSRDAYIQRLREKGYVEINGQVVTPTQAGYDALGSDYQPLPTGVDLQTYWNQRLPEGERKILSVLIASHPNAVARNDLDEATGYKRSSRDAYIQRLKSRRLVITQGSEVTASETLFS